MNDEAFSVLTPESSYWIGFIMADGCVNRKTRMTVGLQLSDAAHLEKLRVFLKASYSVYLYPKRNKCVLAVISEKLTRDLGLFGVVPLKSKKNIKPHTDLANNRDFWRGMIVGLGVRGRRASKMIQV